MNKEEQAFVKTVWEHYRRHGRRSLPWRKTRNPYRILVSEVMLQQTQVDRVIPKYHAFLNEFPTVHSLASAPLGDVLRAWQGLGYNRRAQRLHTCAQKIVGTHKGKFPNDLGTLQSLPGIGPYTAGAVMVFAFNERVSIIETNIRTVYLHHFFKNRTGVSDRDISRLIAITLDIDDPREWYCALMDYGAHLKKELGNQNHRNRHYAKQPRFEGSDRQIRGAILRELSSGNKNRHTLTKRLDFDTDRIKQQLTRLIGEEMVVEEGEMLTLPN